MRKIETIRTVEVPEATATRLLRQVHGREAMAQMVAQLITVLYAEREDRENLAWEEASRLAGFKDCADVRRQRLVLRINGSGAIEVGKLLPGAYGDEEWPASDTAPAKDEPANPA